MTINQKGFVEGGKQATYASQPDVEAALASTDSQQWLAAKLREAKAEARNESAKLICRHCAEGVKLEVSEESDWRGHRVKGLNTEYRYIDCPAAPIWLRARAEELEKPNQKGGSDETHS